MVRSFDKPDHLKHDKKCLKSAMFGFWVSGIWIITYFTYEKVKN